MTRRLRYDGWQVWSTRDTARTGRIMAYLCGTPRRRLLKDDHNSLVYRTCIDDEELVVKVPTARNRRGWERFRTLFQAGKARRMWAGMITLRKRGFVTTEPVLTAHRRRLGMIIDSFIVYVYTEGEPVSPEDAPAIDTLLRRLHSLGYLRHDASAHNFIKREGRIIMLDTTLHRPLLFLRSRCLLEHLAFRRHTPDAWFALYRDSVPRYRLRLLHGYQTWRDALTRTRRRIRHRP